jgi:hypothetical protein
MEKIMSSVHLRPVEKSFFSKHEVGIGAALAVGGLCTFSVSSGIIAKVGAAAAVVGIGLIAHGAIGGTPRGIKQHAKRFQKVPGSWSLVPTRTHLNQETIDRELRPDRLQRLQNLNQEYRRSLENPNPVASKYFPETEAWYIGPSPRGSPSLEFDMFKIGKENKIDVITDFYHTLYDLQKYSNLGIVFFDYTQLVKGNEYREDFKGVFPQDFLDFNQHGSVQIPAMPTAEQMRDQDLGEHLIPDPLIEARKARSPIWQWIYGEEDKPSIHSDYLGRPFRYGYSAKAVALASAMHVPVSMNLTYNEGGNSLIGEKNSKPYVIIGKDSYAVSKFLMEQDLQREMTDDEIQMAFAIDYGVAKEDVYFVEQPGDFHLDMSMAIVGEKTVLLNDSAKAQEKFEEAQDAWLDGWKNESSYDAFVKDVEAERADAQVRKKLEDIAEKDLNEAGFNVVRVAGKFNYSSRSHAMNLFNMVTAQTPDKQNIAIMMGCINQDYQRQFQKIIESNCDKKPIKFYFLPIGESLNSLYMRGGISCRTKTIGRRQEGRIKD